jgi:hypothetical protein
MSRVLMVDGVSGRFGTAAGPAAAARERPAPGSSSRPEGHAIAICWRPGGHGKCKGQDKSREAHRSGMHVTRRGCLWRRIWSRHRAFGTFILVRAHVLSLANRADNLTLLPHLSLSAIRAVRHASYEVHPLAASRALAGRVRAPISASCGQSRPTAAR